ncbi:hypothetical protein [Mycobacterium shigaense]|uniref:Uncharacterized protein n=1 Tax=Mycobacterium shigaense TaxID=722731 RepID=A0A1Z4EFS5_9MYCO|nr:hypothetical protein [Mycobacterium shigaense]MEA1124371.1 hypothetical protein [Mycobacterium shigaense]PRI16518.1 hypothetical protein B2J96_07050 [Mycobacterium shigaense]BAX91796.1 hypothetical protein MSG_01642 [Mycobacterium shigaense]
MEINRITAGAVAAAALAATLVGCSSAGSSSKSGSATPAGTAAATTTGTSAPTSSSQARPSDYTGLLIQTADIDAPIPFVAGPPTTNPNGQPGATITFSSQPHPADQDGVTVKEVQIRDTIQVLPDAGAATSALNAAKVGRGIVADPKADPANVGTGGTTLTGTSPDGSKGVTALLFTEGRAFVTLEFVSAPDSPPPPPDFVIDMGKKQDAAVKKGLGG